MHNRVCISHDAHPIKEMYYHENQRADKLNTRPCNTESNKYALKHYMTVTVVRIWYLTAGKAAYFIHFLTTMNTVTVVQIWYLTADKAAYFIHFMTTMKTVTVVRIWYLTAGKVAYFKHLMTTMKTVTVVQIWYLTADKAAYNVVLF